MNSVIAAQPSNLAVCCEVAVVGALLARQRAVDREHAQARVEDAHFVGGRCPLARSPPAVVLLGSGQRFRVAVYGAHTVAKRQRQQAPHERRRECSVDISEYMDPHTVALPPSTPD